MSRMLFGFVVAAVLAVLEVACAGGSAAPSAPSTSVHTTPAGSSQPVSTMSAAEPPFNVEAILRGDGFGLVTFRQARDEGSNVIDLDVWVRDLAPNSSYSLQRAVDTALDGVCTSTSWLTLGQGLTPHSIDTDDKGTGRASLWRDVSSIAAGTAFDIYFRVIETGTTNVVLQSDCYRYIVRD
jgi:hypothetical protein